MLCKAEKEAGIQDTGQLFLGMDFGTSGARFALIDKHGKLYAEGKREYSNPSSQVHSEIDWATSWKNVLFKILEDIPQTLCSRVSSISVDGTSATTMMIDRSDFKFYQYPNYSFHI
ncbi:D-ribulose kinase-like [Nymphaea colorata]|uniref:D-ribulose kinase-like n=1 Tax=Nymphaea colorata TaxID=210225 RepID=UPI00129E9A25|nr:D-ribulose kinase-like [Nymphaea colorata]